MKHLERGSGETVERIWAAWNIFVVWMLSLFAIWD
jgi:hypothetical protein